jgi:hypothetical protein
MTVNAVRVTCLRTCHSHIVVVLAYLTDGSSMQKLHKV